MVTADRVYRQAFDGTLEARPNYRSAKVYDREAPRDETTLFSTSKKQLVFIAGLHISERTRFVDFMEEVIKKTKPGVILLEMPNDLNGEYIKTANVGKTEVGYAILFARKYDASIMGMDLKRDETFLPYLKHKDKDAIKAGILIETIRYYTWLHKRHASDFALFSKRDFYDFAVYDVLRNISSGWYGDFKVTFMRLLGQYHGPLIDRVKSINKEAARRYVSKKYSIEKVLEMDNIQAPYPFGKKELNKIVRWQDAWRNKSMIDTCMKALRSNDRVVALAGSGHIYECRNLLAEEMKRKFGKVKVTRWGDL